MAWNRATALIDVYAPTHVTFGDRWRQRRPPRAVATDRHEAVTEQPSYSILQRGIETHVLPVTEEYGLGVLVWSPLASGWLSGAIREGQDITANRSTLMPQRFDLAAHEKFDTPPALLDPAQRRR